MSRHRHKRHQAKGEDETPHLSIVGYACHRFPSSTTPAVLMPLHGDSDNMCDRFDARHSLHNLSAFECPPSSTAITDSHVLAEERIADELRYEQLHRCEADDRLREHHLEMDKRTAGAAIPFAYSPHSRSTDGDSTPPSTTMGPMSDDYETCTESEEEAIPYEPIVLLKVPNVVTCVSALIYACHATSLQPPSKQVNAIIEKTAAFVCDQGAQMEIVIKARQRGSDKFDFLDWEHPLNLYYRHVLKQMKGGRYTAQPPLVHVAKVKRRRRKRRAQTAVVVDKELVNGTTDSDDSSDGEFALHPSLLGGAATSNTNSATSTPTNVPPAASETSSDYTIGTHNDVYSAIFNNITAITSAESRRADEERKVRKRVELEERRDKYLRADSTIAMVSKGGHKMEGAPPHDYLLWHKWFYGYEAAVGAPVVTPVSPDLTPVVNRVAEFVARFGAAAEQHLRRVTDLAFDFLQAESCHYTFYQLRLRWLLYDSFYRNQPPPPSHAPPPPTTYTPRPPPMRSSASMPVFPRIPPPPLRLPIAPDRSAVVTLGVVTTMRTDIGQPSTSTASAPTAADKQRQMERREKAREFLANIMKEKRAKREAEAIAHALRLAQQQTAKCKPTITAITEFAVDNSPSPPSKPDAKPLQLPVRSRTPSPAARRSPSRRRSRSRSPTRRRRR